MMQWLQNSRFATKGTTNESVILETESVEIPVPDELELPSHSQSLRHIFGPSQGPSATTTMNVPSELPHYTTSSEDEWLVTSYDSMLPPMEPYECYSPPLQEDSLGLGL